MPVVRSCPACRTANRVPARHLSDEGRCGSCKAVLPAMAEPIEADAALFDEVVRESPVPVLVDFWAAWCGPCRMVAPEVARAAETLRGQAVVLKVDTDAFPQLAERFGVQGIPNFVILREGHVVFQRPGYAPHTHIEEWARAAGARTASR